MLQPFVSQTGAGQSSLSKSWTSFPASPSPSATIATSSPGPDSTATEAFQRSFSKKSQLPEAVGIVSPTGPDRVRRVTSVTVWQGSLVDQIQFQYLDGSKKNFGKVGGACQTPWAVPTGEVIVEIQAQVGASLDGCQFATSGGSTSPWYGGRGGKPFTFRARDGFHIVGLKMQAGGTTQRLVDIVEEEQVRKPVEPSDSCRIHRDYRDALLKFCGMDAPEVGSAVFSPLTIHTPSQRLSTRTSMPLAPRSAPPQSTLMADAKVQAVIASSQSLQASLGQVKSTGKLEIVPPPPRPVSERMQDNKISLPPPSPGGGSFPTFL